MEDPNFNNNYCDRCNNDDDDCEEDLECRCNLQVCEFMLSDVCSYSSFASHHHHLFLPLVLSRILLTYFLGVFPFTIIIFQQCLAIF